MAIIAFINQTRAQFYLLISVIILSYVNQLLLELQNLLLVLSKRGGLTMKLVLSNGCNKQYSQAHIPLGPSRLDTTQHVRRVQPMHFGCVELVEQHGSTRSSRRARHVKRVVSRRDVTEVTSQVEFWIMRCLITYKSVFRPHSRGEQWAKIVHWRRLHGAKASHFYKWLETGGTVSIGL